MTEQFRIIVTRDRFLEDRTLSKVSIVFPGATEESPFGFALEDRDRKVEEDFSRKERGRTAIPVGVYKVRLYNSPKHGRDTPELVDVPGFRHIQIHSGNKPEDTDGCLLVGLDRHDASQTVLRSRVACDWLRHAIKKQITRGGEVLVEVRRAT